MVDVVVMVRKCPSYPSYTRQAMQVSSVPSLLGRVVVKRFQTSSIGPVVMSVAGSALLFGIGTEALP
jgi:hypothetical protein